MIQEIFSARKNLNNQARSGTPKTMGSEAVP